MSLVSFFAKCRSYGSCMEDTAVKHILEYTHDKGFVSNNFLRFSYVLPAFNHPTAKQILMDLGHPPRLYEGENDNQEFFEIICDGSCIRYLSRYAIHIINWKIQAYFWSDTVMPETDRLHTGSGAFQNDHILSPTNRNATVCNKIFKFNLECH